MLHSADILFAKSLYDQSRRILRSAEKLALKHGENEIILAIVKKQKRLLETSGYLSATEKDIEKIEGKVFNGSHSTLPQRSSREIKQRKTIRKPMVSQAFRIAPLPLQ